MNPSKVEETENIFRHHLDPHHQFLNQSQPLILDQQDEEEPFFAGIGFFRDDEDEEACHSSSDADQHQQQLEHQQLNDGVLGNPNPNPDLDLGSDKGKAEKRHRRTAAYISPEPYISSQFYTFNRESHALMTRCLVEGRVATAEEIRAVTPTSVLKSWRLVWKDRNEDTAYLTAWKRIQDKLVARSDPVNGKKEEVGDGPLDAVLIYIFGLVIMQQSFFPGKET